MYLDPRLIFWGIGISYTAFLSVFFFPEQFIQPQVLEEANLISKLPLLNMPSTDLTKTTLSENLDKLKIICNNKIIALQSVDQSKLNVTERHILNERILFNSNMITEADNLKNNIVDPTSVDIKKILVTELEKYKIKCAAHKKVTLPIMNALTLPCTNDNNVDATISNNLERLFPNGITVDYNNIDVLTLSNIEKIYLKCNSLEHVKANLTLWQNLNYWLLKVTFANMPLEVTCIEDHLNAYNKLEDVYFQTVADTLNEPILMEEEPTSFRP